MCVPEAAATEYWEAEELQWKLISLWVGGSQSYAKWLLLNNLSMASRWVVDGKESEEQEGEEAAPEIRKNFKNSRTSLCSFPYSTRKHSSPIPPVHRKTQYTIPSFYGDTHSLIHCTSLHRCEDDDDGDARVTVTVDGCSVVAPAAVMALHCPPTTPTSGTEYIAMPLVVWSWIHLNPGSSKSFAVEFVHRKCSWDRFVCAGWAKKE